MHLRTAAWSGITGFMQTGDLLQQVDRTYVRFRGRRLSYFSGCDYFRLGSDPRVLRAIEEGLSRYGLNVSASRMTTGNHLVYERLERVLGDFLHAEAVTLVSSGYVAGLTAAQALAGEFSHALLDERSHPALHEAAAALGCPVLTYRNRDVCDLEHRILHCRHGAKLILLTDGMFAFDGSVAPLERYVKVLPKDAWLMVDDSHAVGVLGSAGRGTFEHCGIIRKRTVQLLTLSKAFGVFGGAVAGNLWLQRRIIERSRAFIGSTPIPLPMVTAALEALSLVKERGRTLREKLMKRTAYVRQRLRRCGIDVNDTPGPIVYLEARNASSVQRLKRDMLRSAIYPPLIRYPGSSEGYFRFVISSEHQHSQLAALAAILGKNAETFSLAPRELRS